MRTINTQKGVAIILMAVLIGISVVGVTATVATNHFTKKESNVTGHAQVNTQMLAWSGVSAFSKYIVETGSAGFSKIQELELQTAIDLTDSQGKKVTVSNINISGCTISTDPCKVSADISSNSETAKSSTKIQAVYSLAIIDNIIQVVNKKGTFNFGGDVNFLPGSHLIDSEIDDAEVEINAGGKLTLNLGFKTNNISKLSLNAVDDVYIDCGASNCGDATIDVTTKGKVTLLTGKKFGEIKALGSVTMHTGSQAGNILSGSNVTLLSGSKSGDIQSKGDVSLSTASAGNITAEGKVTLSASSAQDVVTNKSVFMDTGASAKSVSALEYVYMMTNSYVANDVIARGDERTTQNSTVYLISWSTVNGNIFAKGDIRLIATSKVGGKAYSSERVRGLGTGSTEQNSSDATVKANALTAITVNVAGISALIDGQANFDVRVDVTAYKDEANYIFTKDSGAGRIYLNKLKNKANNATYIYEHNAQFLIDEDDNKEHVSNNGFALGNYYLGAQKYTGAICLEVSDGTCQTEIIGYLPRISVGWTLGINDSNSYVRFIDTWNIRSVMDKSSINNASLAPGIMYFDAKLVIAGNPNWSADSTSNTYTNSFLAEGSIDAIAFSPRIYSPYNVVRGGNASLVCDRPLKSVSGSLLDLESTPTSPNTLSGTYLMPTNLCKNANAFAYNMHKDENGNVVNVSIDNTPTPKIDLGNVALMSNNIVRVGACAQIYGDILARNKVEGSAGCGFTTEPNAIVGNISVQAKTDKTTTFGSGTHFKVPAPSSSGGGNISANETLIVTGSKLEWSFYK